MTTLTDPRAAASRLVARTRELELPPGGRPDLIAAAGESGLLWSSAGSGFAGLGTALRLELPDGLADPEGARIVTEALGAIADPSGTGSGALALGALPFDRAAPGELVVPSALLAFDGERARITTVTERGGDSGERAELLAGELVAAASLSSRDGGHWPVAPDGFELRSSRPHREWVAAVAEAVEAVERGELDKVVLARRVEVLANAPLPTGQILERLAALYPTCMLFRVGSFLGASPELLVSRRAATVTSHPLAGTVARSGDAAADRALVEGLLASSKDRAEHAFVVEDLRSRLAPWCCELEVPDRPSVLELRNVSHLGTRLTGRLAAGSAGPSALQLAAALHPTPAVAGSPTEAATRYIASAEGLDRGCYAGPVGWMDASGDGEWAIGIRSAVVEGSRAELFAGVGVVAGSDPMAELAETQLKLQALLAAVVRP